jgi:cytochrome c-type biogenesis protein CcmE
MKRKHQRLLILAVCGAGLATAAGLVLTAFNDNIVFFVSPSDLTGKPPNGRQMRLGGLVEAGTVARSASGSAGATFKVTDGKADIVVTYKGILPDLFREGQGVVVLGAQQPDGVFKASEVLAKHDETYMPKEVAESLKKSGQWKPEMGTPAPAAVWNPGGKRAGP